jgi:Fe-S-cluster-containing hydrogenase component 2
MFNSFFGLFDEGKNEKTDANSENKKIVVYKQRCPQNHPCPSVRVCPEVALSQKGYAAPEVDEEKCIKCGKCVRYCAMGAITFS